MTTEGIVPVYAPMLPPKQKIGLVIPSYVGNELEQDRCVNALGQAIWHMLPLQRFDFKFYIKRGDRVPVEGPTSHPSWIKRDREIARCRWAGMREAFADECAWIIMVDTDVIVPPDFLFHMLLFDQTAEAKACHIRGTNGSPCRHVGWPSSQILPCATEWVPIAGEVIMLRRSLWDRMDKTVAAWRPNEDFEIAEKVRNAGALYRVVGVTCYAD